MDHASFVILAESEAGAGLSGEDIAALIDVLGKANAGRSLKALHFGPPIDDLQDVAILRAARNACANLTLLRVWGFGTLPDNPDDPWIWTEVGPDELQGTALSV